MDRCTEGGFRQRESRLISVGQAYFQETIFIKEVEISYIGKSCLQMRMVRVRLVFRPHLKLCPVCQIETQCFLQSSSLMASLPPAAAAAL